LGGGNPVPGPKIVVAISSSSLGSAARLDARRTLDRQIGCLGPAAVGGHDGHRHTGITPDVADLQMLHQMSGDELIAAVGRSLQVTQTTLTCGLPSRLVVTNVAGFGTDELAGGVVELHDATVSAPTDKSVI
jgi:hypothetical protein